MPTAAQTSDKHNENRRSLSLEQRSRSVPYKKHFIVAVLATLLFHLGVVAFITCVVAFFVAPPDLKRGAAFTLAAMPPICAFLWIFAYFKRRKAICPLCKCPPFLDNLAHKHQKAFRFKPFNHGTTAVLNVVLAQRWRCMHCGTPFDLLKPKRDFEPAANNDSNKEEKK